MISRDEVEEFFKRMDRDFDGRLSFEEFMGELGGKRENYRNEGF